MRKFLLAIALLLLLVIGGLVLLTGVPALRLNRGMTRQEIEQRLKPGRFTASGSHLFYNDRLGIYMGRRNFLIATQHVVIRLGPDSTATNVSSSWTWRSKL